MKGKLLKYEAATFQALNSDEFTFELTMEVGLVFKKEKIVQYGVPNHHSIQEYTDHWDKLIKLGKKVPTK